MNGHSNMDEKATAVIGMDMDEKAIAIVGMACRFPGDCNSPSKLWEFLEANQSAQSMAPTERFNMKSFYHPQLDRPGSIPVSGGYFLKENLWKFDASFFGIREAEALSMDPQQRMLLEVVYECFEEAGATLDQLSGSNTGCFVGNFTSDFKELQSREPEYPLTYSWTGNTITIMSNRISYCFNLKGPSMTLDTACSSSMYALHLACNSILAGECELALACGANLIMSINEMLDKGKSGVLSGTSTCHTFDESADGYGRADGIGVLLVKKLSDAIRDNDPIRAIIRSTAVNANGRTSGITQPSREGQAAVIREAYRRAGNLDLRATGYFECHGTGTPVGDPLEVSAVADVFALERSEERPLLIGSVKSNLGHSEPTSALSGIMKAVLAMEKGIIPATIGISSINPRIDLKDGALKVVTTNTPWPPELTVRRASVNSFGFGGANAHTILEAINPKESGIAFPRDRSPLQDGALNGYGNQALERLYLFVTSAQDKASLDLRILQLEMIADDYEIQDLTYTLSTRRTHFQHRSYAIVHDKNIANDLKVESNLKFANTPGSETKVAFVFTGQGAQWKGMGRELIRSVPGCFETATYLENVLQSLEDGPEWRLKDVMLETKDTDNFNSPEYAQPLTTALQIIIVDFLQKLGVEPTAVIGHSSGEISAAYCAGYITAEAAIKLAYYRGRIASIATNQGAMLAVGLGESEVLPHIEKYGPSEVTIACFNSDNSVTLAGQAKIVAAIQEELIEKGIFARLLFTGGKAYHSPHMAEAGKIYSELSVKAFESSVKTSKKRTNIRFFSSVTGREMGPSGVDASYFTRNLLSPVLFKQGLDSMVVSPGSGVNHAIEIGPHAALAGPIKRLIKSYSPTIIRNKDSLGSVFSVFGDLYLQNYPFNLQLLNSPQIFDSNLITKERNYAKGRTIINLPKYKWNHSRLYRKIPRWVDEWHNRKFPRHDLLGSRVPGMNISPIVWRNKLKTQSLPWLKDHDVAGSVVFPAAGYICMVVESITQILEERESPKILATQTLRYGLRQMHIKNALMMPESGDVEIFLEMRPLEWNYYAESDNSYEFSIRSLSGSDWAENARGIIAAYNYHVEHESILENSASLEDIPTTTFYGQLNSQGLSYGPKFARLSNIQRHESTSRARAVLLPVKAEQKYPESRYVIHPSTLDTALQLQVVSFFDEDMTLKNCFLPCSFDEISIYPGKAGCDYDRPMIVQAIAKLIGPRSISGNARISIGEKDTVINIQGVRCVELDSRGHEVDQTQMRHPYSQSVWKPHPSNLTQDKSIKLFSEAKGFQASVSMLDMVEDLSALCILDTLEVVSNLKENVQQNSDYLPRYKKWMIHQKTRPEFKVFAGYSTTRRQAEINVLSTTLRDNAVPETEPIMSIRENSNRIFTGEITAFEAVNQGDVWNNLYESGITFKHAYKHVKTAVDILAHENPRMRVLELGAGTGGLTISVFETLVTPENFRRYGSYTFTDISSTFFPRARERFSKMRNMEYMTLDVEQDMESQGFEHGSYDLVLAANVVHATANIQNVLSNIKKLLQPTGKLILVETTTQLLSAGYTMGSLPGWWLAEEEIRKISPLLSVPEWRSFLENTNYEDIMNVGDMPKPHTRTSIIIATAGENKVVNGNSPNGIPRANGITKINSVPVTNENPAHKTEKITLLSRDYEPVTVKKFLRKIISALESTRLNLEIKNEKIGDHSVEEGGVVICMLESGNSPFFSTMTALEYEGMQQLFRLKPTILWVTDSEILNGNSPEVSAVAGFTKSLMQEYAGIRIITYDLSISSLSPDLTARRIMESLNKFGQDHGPPHVELAENPDGIVHVNHIYPATALNRVFSEKLLGKKSEQSFESLGPVEMDMDHTGSLETMHWKTDDKVNTPLPPGFVEVEVLAIGMNMKDLITIMGRYDQLNFSNEGAGYVTRVGKEVTEYKPGDRVLCLGDGNFGTHMRGKAESCVKIHENESFEEMVTMPVVYLTALMCLEGIARLEEGESVLIHTAAGGVGIAAIQVAQMIGAEIYATVGSQEKRDYLQKHYNIPASHIFDSRSISFARDLKKATHDRGVDVVLNSTTNELLRESVASLAPLGRHIEIGKRDLLDFGKLDLSTLLGTKLFAHFYLKDIILHNPKSAQRALQRMMSLYRTGKIRAITPMRIFPIGSLDKALRYFMEGVHIGKVVISLDRSTRPNRIQYKSSLYTQRFPRDAVYIMVGCLGGLGKSFTEWMLKRGARHFVFLSRTSLSNASNTEFVKSLRERGAECRVVQGDVSEYHDVEKVVLMAGENVRGVVHAAMNIKDTFFENSTLSDFNACYRPKVIGALNLHHALIDRKLDFFLSTSSLTAIVGVPGQSNYAAANSFLNAFTNYRHSLGLPSATVSLGLIQKIGYVSQNPQLIGYLSNNIGCYPISEKEFLLAMEAGIMNQFKESGGIGTIHTGFDPVEMKKFSATVESFDARYIWAQSRVNENQFDDMTAIGSLNATGNHKVRIIDTLVGLDRENVYFEVLASFSQKLAKMLEISKESIDASKKLAMYGIDSLTATELRTWFLVELEMDLPILTFTGPGKTVGSIVDDVCTTLHLDENKV